MNFFIPLLCTIPILFGGCLYFNDRGVSTHLYENCEEYYDACGIYHKECPKNVADYSEIEKEFSTVSKRIFNAVEGCGTCPQSNRTTQTCHEPAADTH